MPRKLDPESFRPYTYKPTASTAPSRPKQPQNDRGTVNALLQHLRTHQTPRFSDDDSGPVKRTQHSHYRPPPTVPPTLQSLLGATPLPPPPPRRGLPPRRRRIPGPPPPASWLQPPQSNDQNDENPELPVVRVRGRLPDVRRRMPKRGDLTDLMLRQMAKNWRWHLRKEAEYLHYLPTHHKELLFGYLAAEGAMPYTYGLAALLGGGEEVRSLDLSHSIGAPGFTLQDVADLLWPKKRKQEKKAEEELESWEDALDQEEEEGTGEMAVDIEELGLAYPADGGDWDALLEVLERVGAGLRGLSLVGWKPPKKYGVLRKVARATLGLKWIEVGVDWRGVWEEVEWKGAWRGVEEVCVVGGDEEVRRELGGWIRKVRREGGGREFVRIVEGKEDPEVFGE